MKRYDVAVLGATGMVGQRFIQGLVDHPYFNLVALAASERSAGKRYEDCAKWYIEGEMPEEVRDVKVVRVDPEEVQADIVFSALPNAIAMDAEPAFAKAGSIVCSNASSYRMTEDVPLLIPEVNPEHLDLIDVQQEKRGWDGAIITNPNCSSTMFVLPLKPIYEKFGIENMFVATLQAVSGAGYDGVPSMAILDNVIPYIPKEEHKDETESLKMLGEFDSERIIPADFTISAVCHRVPTLDGHLESCFVKTRDDASMEDIKAAMRDFTALPQELELPTAPVPPVIVREEENRPQTRLDRDAGGGMAVTVGRIREDPILTFKFTCLGHNTIRGAAGASILNAEMLVKTRGL
jgi:aspartate-semialdehyde dehydrogenase